jgi:hypothetical protein
MKEILQLIGAILFYAIVYGLGLVCIGMGIRIIWELGKIGYNLF